VTGHYEIEVAKLPNGEVAVCDASEPCMVPYLFSREQWEEFIGSVKRGNLDWANLPDAEWDE
jgi:hypothetical protein